MRWTTIWSILRCYIIITSLVAYSPILLIRISNRVTESNEHLAFIHTAPSILTGHAIGPKIRTQKRSWHQNLKYFGNWRFLPTRMPKYQLGFECIIDSKVYWVIFKRYKIIVRHDARYLDFYQETFIQQLQICTSLFLHLWRVSDALHDVLLLQRKPLFIRIVFFIRDRHSSTGIRLTSSHSFTSLPRIKFKYPQICNLIRRFCK